MPVSPLQDASALLRIRLTSEGSDVSSAVSLLSATVERAMDKAATATLVFLEGDPASQAFALSESATFWLGARITASSCKARRRCSSAAAQRHALVMRRRMGAASSWVYLP